MADAIRTRIIHPHTNLGESDCYHEWVAISPRDARYDGGPTYYWRNALGHDRHGYYRWERWCCNNSTCEGEIIVCRNDIEAIVNAAKNNVVTRG